MALSRGLGWTGLLVFAVVIHVAHTRSTDFPPGWNGLALTPPMGWRSWNAFGNRGCTQVNMQSAIDALTDKLWTIDGKANQSLFDAGYGAMGIDEGWEGCGQGINGTQHTANGDPVINTARFPDTAGLVKYGHERGLKIGWYENGCACGERRALEQNYEGDVRVLHAMGFDGVKLDGCGAQRNMTLYAELMKATGKAFLIENCHWGRCTASDDSSCPTKDWCPFNWFRTSGDINASPMSWLGNLQTTIQFQDPVAPLSRPGCWAYPDMLEVGRIIVDGKMDHGWNRAHFGAWCVISAPLILGMDLTQQQTLSAVLDVITNPEAIAVNQEWAGHPGRKVWTGVGSALGYPAARACNPTNPALQQAGWSLKSIGQVEAIEAEASLVALAAPGGGCLKVQGHGYPGGAGGLVIAVCNSTDPAQSFTYDTSTKQLKTPSGRCVDVHSGGPIVWLYGCTSGPNDVLSFNDTDKTLSMKVGAGLCLGVEQDDPAGSTASNSLQAWAKPMKASSTGADGVAVLLINPDTQSHEFNVPLSVMPLTGAGGNLTAQGVGVRDIWVREDLPALPTGTEDLVVTVGPLDSAFFRLSTKA